MKVHFFAQAIASLVFLFSIPGFSFEARGSGQLPEMTEAQRDCLDQYKADAELEDEPPSRAEMEKFFEKCQIPKRSAQVERKDRRDQTNRESRTEADACDNCQAEAEARMNQLENQLRQLQMIVMVQKTTSAMGNMGAMGGMSSYGGMNSYGMSNMGMMGMGGMNGMFGMSGMGTGMNMMGGMGMMNPMSSMGMMSSMYMPGMGSYYLGAGGSLGMSSNYGLYGMGYNQMGLGSSYGISTLPRTTTAGTSTLPMMSPYSNYGMGTGMNYTPTSFWRGY